MKKIFLLATACFAMLVSCTKEKDIDLNTYGGKGLEFVHFASASEGWLVTETDPSYVHEVTFACTYTHDQDVTYKVRVGKNTTGVEGTDFKLNSTSVTIKKGEYMGTIPVEVLYATTGLGFGIELILDVEDSKINPAYGNSCAVTVKTDKVTIDWAWLEGKWTAQDTAGDPYSMEIKKVDETTADFYGEWGCSGIMRGTVDFTARTVTFTGEFDMEPDYYDGGTLKVRPATGSTFTAVLSPLGITISNMDFYISGGGYDGWDFGEDTTTLTR